MRDRFDLRRRSTGLALGDPVTPEQTAEAMAYALNYRGSSNFVLSVKMGLAQHGRISRRQVAAVLQIKAQEAAG